MIRNLISTAMLYMVSISTIFAAGETVVGSAPDLTTNSSVVGGVFVCAFCHGVHSTTAPEVAPLWDRSDPVTEVFTLYSSGTLDSGVGQPGIASLIACLATMA